MTYQEIIDRFRSEIVDDLIEPYAWNSELLIQFINDWQAEVLEDCYAIEDSATYYDPTSNPTECLIAVTSGTHTYDIDPDLNLLYAKYGIAQAELIIRSRKRLRREYSDWETTTSATPTHLITEGIGLNKIRLWPTPNADANLYLWGYKIVFTQSSLSDLDEFPVIRTDYHKRIFNYLAYRAYNMQNSEAYDAQKSADYKDKWENEDRPYIKLLEIRRKERNPHHHYWSNREGLLA